MLMDLSELVAEHDMHIDGVLHAGAHLAEEAETYAALGCGKVWWIEGNPNVIPKIEYKLRKFPGQQVIPALIYSVDGAEIDFNITNYDGMSSSILEFGTHPEFSPDTVFVELVRQQTRCIDSLVKEHGIVANFLNMDLQGAEMYALCGAVDSLQQFNWIMTEVNKAQVYKGAAQVEDLDSFLHDFERVETYWVGDQGWGDALYVRRI